MFNSKVKQEPVKKATHINDSSFISYCPLTSDEFLFQKQPLIKGTR